MKHLALIMAVLLCSCATKYQRRGWSGGYSDQQLQKNIFRVSTDLNKFSSKDRAEDFTMYRACEVTLKNGYDYFIITDSENTTTTSISGSSKSADYGYHRETTLSVGSAIKPGRMIIIKTFKGTKPKNNVNAYNARELMGYLEKSNKSIRKAKEGSLWQRMKKKIQK